MIFTKALFNKIRLPMILIKAFSVCCSMGIKYSSEPNCAYLLHYDNYRGKYVTSSTAFADFIKPYMVYYDSNGTMKDRYFDTFILLDHFTYYGNPLTANTKWWQNYISRTFGTVDCVALDANFVYDHAARLEVRESCISLEHEAQYASKVDVSFKCRNKGGHDPGQKDGYLGFRFYDIRGNELTSIDKDLIKSSYLNLWYTYFDAGLQWNIFTINIDLPKGTDHFKIYIGNWLGGDLMIDDIYLNNNGVMSNESFDNKDNKWRMSIFPAEEYMVGYDRIIPVMDSLLGLHADIIGRKKFPRNAVLSIPWSFRSHESNNFGMIEGKRIDLSKKQDSYTAVKWFIDQCIESWREYKPKNVKLIGFYWLNEEGNDLSYIDLTAIKDYIHKKGYKFYASAFNSLWLNPSLGPDYFNIFDLIWLQPNVWPDEFLKTRDYDAAMKLAIERGGIVDEGLHSQNKIPLNKLNIIDELADSLSAGIVIEWIQGQENSQGYGRVIDYLNMDGKLSHDFSGKKIAVYDDRGFGRFCCQSDLPVYRQQYDAVYKFIKDNHGIKK